MTRRPRLAAAAIVAAWVVAAGLAAPFASRLSGIQQNDQASFLPTSAESTQVSRYQARFQSTSSVPVVLVYERATGITAADRTAISEQAAAVAATAGVVGTPSPLLDSKDGQAVEVLAGLDSRDLVKLGSEVDAVRAKVRGGGGLDAWVTGPAALAADFGNAFKDLDVKLLAGTAAVVILILLLVYRSPFLWMLPVGVVGIALFCAQALVYVAATKFGLRSNGQSQGILTILVFGAGTDYALLLISRYREELRKQASSVRALATAWRSAAPAILASGTTVTLSLLVLLLSEQGANRTLGASSAIGVAVVMIAMLTLTPAVLALSGRRLFWPRVPRAAASPSEWAAGGVWHRIAAAVGRRPRTTWLGAAALVMVLAGGLTQLHATGLPADRQYTVPLASVTGQHVADAHFPNGIGGTLYVVSAAAGEDRVATALRSVDGVRSVTAFSGSGIPNAPPKVVDGRVLLLAQTSVPADGAAAQALVVRARSAVHAVPQAGALVGGTAATNLDQKLTAERDVRVIIPLVLAVILAVLLVLLRGLVVSLLLIGTVVLSFAATLGASVFLFDKAFHFAGEDPSWPLTTFVFLVALGIDYNIFLVTRVREEARRAGTRTGVLAGLASTGGVITSAGVVLAATFAVFTALPLVVLVEVGFSIALGVLLDTLVVRTLLVPGLMHDLGERIWWPGRLPDPRRLQPSSDHRPTASAGRQPTGPAAQAQDHRSLTAVSSSAED